MPHMIGYLGGDGDTMAARKAVDSDLRLAVDFPDERRMLVVCVMQNGDITMTWTSSQGTGRVDEMYLVAKIAPLGESLIHHTFDINPTPTLIPVAPAVEFKPLKKRNED